VQPVSRSCHSFDCLQDSADFPYVFLSPVCDSISKPGYTGAFTPESLHQAHRQGIINGRVMALGGMNAATIPFAAACGFGGVAVLGALWDDFPNDGDETAVVEQFLRLQSITAAL
jgi:thiamine-phosphate pyrophosphorylase